MVTMLIGLGMMILSAAPDAAPIIFKCHLVAVVTVLTAKRELCLNLTWPIERALITHYRVNAYG